ncbi:MAG: hypothetical protein AAGI09_11950 [Pseudomonadota bacterium]
MADERPEDGKELVRTLFVLRLQEAGAERPKAMKVSDMDAFYKRLVEDLFYMSSENLETLVELLLDQIASDPKRRLPAELVIRQMARSLQAKPATEARIVTSWLRSVEGPRAKAAGYAVELFRFLRQHGRPPGPYDLRKMKERAATNRSQLQTIAENHRVGRAIEDELAWAEAYVADRQRVEALIADGERARAA